MDLNSAKNNNLSVVYITSKNCNVCKVIYPRLEGIVTKYAKINFLRLETDDNPQVTGQFMIFTVPAVVIFSKGKELYRAARYIDIAEVEQMIEEHYSRIFFKGEL